MEAVRPIPKIRSGNEFTFVWAIELDGVAEDLTDISITDLQLTVCVGGLCAERVEVPFTIVDGNKVRSQHLHERTGLYNLELTYKKAGVENEIDIDAFRIVAKSAEASDSTEFAVTSDMAIGFKGDPFTYDDFTPEQIAELQQPATDAIVSIQAVELAVETAEGLRVQAELNRQTDTATAIFNAEQATDDANEKAGLANDAALLANEKAGLAATATTQANEARDNANSAAQAATNLVDSYATDLNAVTVDTLGNTADIRSLENIINSANISQETTATVTGVDTVALPRTAANTGMQVQMFGQSAQNLVVNGDFRNGITGWVKLNTTTISSYQGDLLISAGTNIVDGAGIPITSPINGNKYYLSSRLKPKYTTNIFQVELRTFQPFINAATSKTYTNNQWINLSGIITGTTSGSTQLQIVMRFDNAGDVAGSEILVDNVKLINLTATFGAGNEPTKEQCDLLFANYFEGSDNVLGTGRIRSVNSDGMLPSYLYLTTPELRSNGLIKDEIRKGTNGYELVQRINPVDGTVRATPAITPIPHAGLLNSNSNGTAYFEPIIADAGVYGSNLSVQLTDYPIASFESIRKYANGSYTELSTATAVIASGGLSFTHPDLVSGDLVMFTYAYSKESIGRSMTLTHYDSRFVKVDTANGKTYRIDFVVTNGVVVPTATEV